MIQHLWTKKAGYPEDGQIQALREFEKK